MEQEKLVRHHNGNGRKGEYSEVYPDTFLDRLSVASGENTDILSSHLEEAKIDTSFIFKSTITNSDITGTLVIQAHIKNSEIDCEYIANSLVYNSRISGISKIKNSQLNNVFIENCTIDGGLLVNIGEFGKMIDLKHGYITGGNWHRAPRVLRFPERNVTLTEAENGQLHCNCRKFRREDWIKKAERYARLYKLSKSELEQAISFTRGLPID